MFYLFLQLHQKTGARNQMACLSNLRGIRRAGHRHLLILHPSHLQKRLSGGALKDYNHRTKSRQVRGGPTFQFSGFWASSPYTASNRHKVYYGYIMWKSEWEGPPKKWVWIQILLLQSQGKDISSPPASQNSKSKKRNDRLTLNDRSSLHTIPLIRSPTERSPIQDPPILQVDPSCWALAESFKED